MENPFHVLEERLTSIESILIDLKNKPSVVTELSDEIGGIELAREITGYSFATIYGLVSARKIPHSKQGKRLFFSKKDLTDWIKSGKRASSKELQEKAKSYRVN
jgi:hypothetical protein